MADTVGKAAEVTEAIPPGVWGFFVFIVVLALAAWFHFGGDA